MPEDAAPQPYGDLTALNTNGPLLRLVGADVLRGIVEDYLGLLGTSAAIYEKNGDYAVGIFSSGWCRTLDETSRGLCGTADNREALASGKWHCHESCWKTSRQSIETARPADLACDGGIRIHAVPIVVRGEAIGSINFGYGDPPAAPDALAEVAGRYGLPVVNLAALAAAYEPRPAVVIEIAKTRLQAAARLIGSIVERREAELALRESDRRFRSIFDQVPVSIWVEDWTSVIEAIDALRARGVGNFQDHFAQHPEQVVALLREVRIVDVNPETLKMFGARNKAEMLGSLETIFATPDTLPGFVGELAALGAGEPEYRAEMALRTVHGQSITVLLTMTFPAPGSGSGTVLVSLMDITARRLAEERIQGFNAELEQRVQERTAALELFSYSVSHDLRAPLRAIDGYARVLLEDHGQALGADAVHTVNVIGSETRRMGRLIDELLAFFRLSQAAIRQSDIDMRALASAAWTEVVSAAPRPVECDIGPLPRARGEPVLIRQVWTNLLSNAVKFTRGREPARVEIGYLAAAGGAYYVKDNGVGFDMRFAHKLFHVFERLHGEEEFEGSGIGLALVERIVGRHGGRAWAEGAPGAGATFFFSLAGHEEPQS